MVGVSNQGVVNFRDGASVRIINNNTRTGASERCALHGADWHRNLDVVCLEPRGS